MSATHDHDSTPQAAPKLYLAFELGWTSWNLAFTTAMDTVGEFAVALPGQGQSREPRDARLRAGDLHQPGRQS